MGYVRLEEGGGGGPCRVLRKEREGKREQQLFGERISICMEGRGGEGRGGRN